MYSKTVYICIVTIETWTGSANTRCDRTSLNLQYEVLKTFGAYLRIIEKKS